MCLKLYQCLSQKRVALPPYGLTGDAVQEDDGSFGWLPCGDVVPFDLFVVSRSGGEVMRKCYAV